MLLKNAPAPETSYTIHESTVSISDVVSQSDITADTTTSAETTETTTETTTTTTKNKPKQTAKPTAAPTAPPTQPTGGDNDAGWVDGWY